MTIIPTPDDLQRIKMDRARWLMSQLHGSWSNGWPDATVVEFLEAEGFLWVDGDWRTDTDTDVVVI